jgi:hypothetical protein
MIKCYGLKVFERAKVLKGKRINRYKCSKEDKGSYKGQRF